MSLTQVSLSFCIIKLILLLEISCFSLFLNFSCKRIMNKILNQYEKNFLLWNIYNLINYIIKHETNSTLIQLSGLQNTCTIKMPETAFKSFKFCNSENFKEHFTTHGLSALNHKLDIKWVRLEYLIFETYGILCSFMGLNCLNYIICFIMEHLSKITSV